MTFSQCPAHTLTERYTATSQPLPASSTNPNTKKWAKNFFQTQLPDLPQYDTSLQIMTSFRIPAPAYAERTHFFRHTGCTSATQRSLWVRGIAGRAYGNVLEHRHVAQVGLTASGGRFSRGTMTSSRLKGAHARRKEADGDFDETTGLKSRNAESRFVKITPCLLPSSMRSLEVIVPHSKRPPEAVRPP